MPEVDFAATVPGSQRVIAPRLRRVLVRYVERGRVALTLDLMIAGAVVAVPIALEFIQDRAVPTAYRLRLRAAHHEAWFPTFEGTVGNEPGGALTSTLRLQGTYEVPLGTVGKALNRTLLRNAAERGLRGLLERLRSDVLDEIRRDELYAQNGSRA